MECPLGGNTLTDSLGRKIFFRVFVCVRVCLGRWEEVESQTDRQTDRQI